MSDKRVVVGTSSWAIADGKAVDVIADIKSAMQNGEVATLDLLDGDGKPATVYLNGRVVPTVAIEINSDPKPSEFNG